MRGLHDVGVMPDVDCPPGLARFHVPAREGRPLREAELIARHRAGDAAAFGTLHDRHVGELRALAQRYVDPGRAEDAVQEAFERAHRFLLGDPRALGADFVLGAWLRTVVRRRCIDAVRRDGVLLPLEDGAAHVHAPGPHEHAVLAEELRRLTSAVHALPARQREALVRHVLDGEPHCDVARRLEVTVQATKNLVNRARCELRHSTAA